MQCHHAHVLEKTITGSRILVGACGSILFLLEFYQRDCARMAHGGPSYEGEWPVYLIFSWADQPMKKIR